MRTFVTIALAASMAAQAIARQVDGGLLLVNVKPPFMEESSTELRRWRSLIALDVLSLRVTVENRTSGPLRLSPSSIRSAFTFSVEGQSTNIPVVSSLKAIYLDHIKQTTLSSESPVVDLAPNASVSWDVSLSRRDGGIFERGSYAVSYAIRGMRLGVSGDASSAVRVHEGTWTLTVDVTPAVSTEESVRHHLLVASEAIMREDYETALAAYTAAEQLDTMKHHGRWGIANVYVALGRYPEAIPIFQTILKKNPGHVNAARQLAKAYVGVGQIRSAEESLRRSGHSDADVDKEVGKFREQVEQTLKARVTR